jgi:signal transduction histidine kinase
MAALEQAALPHGASREPRPPAPPVTSRGLLGQPVGLPFVPLLPLLALLVGIAVTLAIGLVGLDHLGRAGDARAGARAELIAVTVAARLAELPEARRDEASKLANRRTSAEILVVTADARVVHEHTNGALDRAAVERMLREGRGVASVRLGRARFAVAPLGPAPEAPRVVALVLEPTGARGASLLVSALAALATLLLVTAIAVAYAASRDVERDVAFVTDRIRGMKQARVEPAGELIPLRTMDEVGVLTAAFNKLVGRFAQAELDYKDDLARANAADRERAAFLAAVSHELRSPLNAILGFADILMAEVDGPLTPAAREEVEQIRGSGQHLLTLINDILELSALESGQLRLSRARVDLQSIAAEVVREARGLALGKPVSVRLEGDAQLLARADGRRVRQILGNLVNNAIKFTQHGEVVVRVEREGPLGVLTVRDTGPGISAAERALIFQEYKQARGEVRRRRGTGLGLAITRRLVSLHKGTIELESEVGRGSSFRVKLPIGQIDAPPSIRPPAMRQASPAPGRGSPGPPGSVGGAT